MSGHACPKFVRVRVRDFRTCPCLKSCPCPKSWLCPSPSPSPCPKSLKISCPCPNPSPKLKILPDPSPCPRPNLWPNLCPCPCMDLRPNHGAKKKKFKESRTSQVQSGRSIEAKVDGHSSRRFIQKWTVLSRIAFSSLNQRAISRQKIYLSSVELFY